MKVIYILALLICATLTSCNLYEKVEIEEIHPPEVEVDGITTPDWDKKETQY